MTKEEVRCDVYRRMIDCENHYPDQIPRPVLSYYLLLSLIHMGSFERWYEQHGLIELDASEVDEGKDEYMRHGRLSEFEMDTIKMLSEETRKKENEKRPIVLSPAFDFRAHG